MEAKQTPLIELLERVPQDARVIVEHDQFSSTSHPVGRLCHEAAAALRAALAEPQTTHWEGCKEVHPECRTAPTPRTPLTLEDIFDGAMATLTRIQKDDWVATDQDIIEFARAIERAHGIGEQT